MRSPTEARRRTCGLLWLVVAAACGGDSAEPPPPPPRIVVTPGSVEAHTSGQTFQFSARVIDSRGNAVSGATVAWTSSSDSVATVSPSGLATVVGQGRATITARVETASGSASIVADLKPGALIKVSGDGQTVPALTQAPEDPTVRVVDAAGLPLSGQLVEFEIVSRHERGSASPRSTRTNDAGEASTRWTLGLAFDDVQDMRVYTDTFYVDFRAHVTTPPLTIWSTSLQHARATVPYEEALEAVGGVPPLVWSAPSEDLPAGMVLDSAGVLMGVVDAEGSSEFDVVVRDAEGTEATRRMSLRSCPAPLSLEVGESIVLDPHRSGACPPFIPAGNPGDRYHVTLVHTVSNPDRGWAEVDLEISEPWPGTPSSTDPLRKDNSENLPAADDLFGGVPSDFGPRLHHQERARMKARILETSERLARELDPEALLPDLRRDARAQRRAATAPPPADRIFVIPTPWEGNPCQELDPVPAALVAYDDFLAIYQDAAQHAVAPVDSSSAAATLEYYAEYGAPTIEEYFGGVSDVNRDGRIVIFVTPVVPSTLWAYVWGADFWRKSECAGSNEMEVVYFGRELFGLHANQERGGLQLAPVMVHEVKHVSSLYRRSASRNWHPRWVEEGTAEIAAEVSARRAMEAVGTIGRAEVLTRSAYPPRSGEIVTPENAGVLNRLARAGVSYAGRTNSITHNPSEDQEHSYYGTSWLFHRFLADAYGGATTLSDSAFFRRLNEASTAPGIAGIEQATDQRMAALLEQYATAMTLVGTGAPQPESAFRTYDLRSAFTDFFRSTAPDWLLLPYPWAATGPEPAGFQDRTWTGRLPPAGIRFHEFESDGAGHGIEVAATVDGAGVKVIVARIR